MTETTVLLVDPTESERVETVGALARALPDANILAVDSYQAAADMLAEQTVDTVITRYQLGGQKGMELVALVREQYPETDCFLFAETEDIETESFEETVVEFVPKEFSDSLQTLVALIEEADTEVGQVPYPVPKNEHERLAALDNYTTDSERASSAFDNIVQLAREHFDVAGVSLTIVDERTQQIIEESGDISPPEERQSSLSTHTLVHDDPVMAVEDIRSDSRFIDETLQSSGIVAYLGAKIEVPEGYVIGTLNLYDDGRRTFSAAEKAYLETLAALVVDVLVMNNDAIQGHESHHRGEGQ